MIKNVAVGMSGGVDSSVAALILKEQGYNVIGITMKIWDENYIKVVENGVHGCYGPGELEDIEDSKKVAEMLGIEFVEFDLKKEYRKIVFKDLETNYSCGKTPNPCVICNHKMKFGYLLEKAKESGIDFDLFATGHYCRINYNKTTKLYELLKGKDNKKDQSYFLYNLEQKQLSKTIFPLGEYLKPEIREIAKKAGLFTALKRESQNFITSGYSEIFKGKEKLGDIIDENGKLLGKHKGIQFYTVGQRKNLGISSSKPLYVKKIDEITNNIIVSTKENIFNDIMKVNNINWTSIERPENEIEANVKIRYQHKGINAIIIPEKNNKATVKFAEPVEAIAPGQSAVFYNNDIVLGGGIIEK